MEPGQLSQDRVFLSVLVTAPSAVSVQIGGHKPTTLHTHMAGIHHFSVPFEGHTGPVHITLSRSQSDIISTVGPDITDQCVDGAVNWNAVTCWSCDAGHVRGLVFFSRGTASFLWGIIYAHVL